MVTRLGSTRSCDMKSACAAGEFEIQTSYIMKLLAMFPTSTKKLRKVLPAELYNS